MIITGLRFFFSPYCFSPQKGFLARLLHLNHRHLYCVAWCLEKNYTLRTMRKTITFRFDRSSFSQHCSPIKRIFYSSAPGRAIPLFLLIGISAISGVMTQSSSWSTLCSSNGCCAIPVFSYNPVLNAPCQNQDMLFIADESGMDTHVQTEITDGCKPLVPESSRPIIQPPDNRLERFITEC